MLNEVNLYFDKYMIEGTSVPNYEITDTNNIEDRIHNFRHGIRNLINKYSIDNDFNLPDYILEDYIMGALRNLYVTLDMNRLHNIEVDNKEENNGTI